MDIETSLRPVPLRHRTETTAEFNQIPAHVFPEHTTREDDGAVSIAGVKLTDIAKQYGTAAFVLDEADFRNRCRRLATAFGGGERVHYASTAFLSKTVCKWVEDEGLSLDVASHGELQVALAAGFPANRITYTYNALHKADYVPEKTVKDYVQLGTLSRLDTVRAVHLMLDILKRI